jgi:hypothetical protein
VPSRATTQLLHKRLSRLEVTERVIRLHPRARFFPAPGQLFDLWHLGLPWGAKIRSETCTCPHPGGVHQHRYIESGELHAGLRWQAGASLNFDVDERNRIQVSGDLVP